MGKALGTCLVLLIVLAALDFFLAWCIQVIWNYLAPLLFHGPQISYWTAFLLMCALSIVGGFFKGSSSSSKSK